MQLAIQLYTVRTIGQADMHAAIADVANAGYSHVESAGYGNLNATDLRNALDEFDVAAISAHVPYDRLRNEFSTVLTEMKILGCQYIVIPWLAPEKRTSEGVTELIANMNRWSQTAQEQGLGFGYHNHDFEFGPLDDSSMFERIARETDPELVNLELDFGWIMMAGADPLDLVQRFSGRVPLLHAKDFTVNGASVTAGNGALPWNELIPAAIAAGCEYLIVENDQPVDPRQDIRDSLATLTAMISQASLSR